MLQLVTSTLAITVSLHFLKMAFILRVLDMHVTLNVRVCIRSVVKFVASVRKSFALVSYQQDLEHDNGLKVCHRVLKIGLIETQILPESVFNSA